MNPRCSLPIQKSNEQGGFLYVQYANGHQICEHMASCRSRQLRAKTMDSYEQGLRQFERWRKEQMDIDDVSKITENIIRRYINELQQY